MNALDAEPEVERARAIVAAAKRQRALAKAYHETFDTPAGEMVLHDLLRAGGVLAVAHVQGDSHSTAHNDGRRSLALHVLDRLRWSEGALAKLASLQTDQSLQSEE